METIALPSPDFIRLLRQKRGGTFLMTNAPELFNKGDLLKIYPVNSKRRILGESFLTAIVADIPNYKHMHIINGGLLFITEIHFVQAQIGKEFNNV